MYHAIIPFLIPLLISPAELKDDIAAAKTHLDELEKKVDVMREKLQKATDQLNQKQTQLNSSKINLDQKKAAFEAFTINDRSDVSEYDRLQSELKAAKIGYKQKKKSYDNAMTYEKKAKNEYFEILTEYESAKKTLGDLVKLEPVSRDARKSKLQFISIQLSSTCEIMIKHNVTNNCPTYSELVQMFDNTNYRISGKFIDADGDIRREKTKMQNHWKYYRGFPEWKIIAVDPNAEFVKRSAVIVIQPNNFSITSKYGTDPNQSFNSTTRAITILDSMKVYDGCTRAVVGPDMADITHVINQIMNSCDDMKLDENTTFLGFTQKMNRMQSAWYQYQDWLLKSLLNCQSRC